MLGGGFTGSGTRNLLKVERIMKEGEDFEGKPPAVSSQTGSGSSLCLPTRRLKHPALLVKNDLQKTTVNVSGWPARLNPTETVRVN